ncbi:MAG TPA: LysR family transcriptional regulator [Rhodopila sp.]|nr:LysR family transcriptional regulator [Rhodopila sp.]
MDWDDLHTFLAIARHGTLSAAARALGVRQTTMGRRLAALEARSGTRLLQKTPHGYVLTASGEAVLGNVERIEAEALAVERRISGRDIRLEGMVRVTTVETLAAEVVMPILAELRARHPGIAVELITETRSLSLGRREADIAIRVARPDQPELAVRRVGAIAYALYGSPDYLARAGNPDFATGGTGHAVIRTLPDLAGLPEMRFLAESLPNASVALATNSRYAQRSAALAGMGIACLARYLGDAAALVRLPPQLELVPRDLWLAVHQDIRHMPRVRAVADALAAGIRARAGILDPPVG